MSQIISSEDFTLSKEQMNILKEHYDEFVLKWPELQDCCEVCLMKEALEKDGLVFCDLCEGLVHQSCYGSELLSSIPQSYLSYEWFCGRCRDFISVYQKSQTLYEKEKEEFQCIFCPEQKGVVKKVMWKENKQEVWAHVGCIVSIKCLAFEDNQRYIISKKYEPSQTSDECNICQLKMGSCAICHRTGCKFSYHPTCGKRMGIIQDVTLMNTLIECREKSFVHDEPDHHIVFCEDHLYELRYLEFPDDQFLKDFIKKMYNQRSIFKKEGPKMSSLIKTLIPSCVKVSHQKYKLEEKYGNLARQRAKQKKKLARLEESNLQAAQATPQSKLSEKKIESPTKQQSQIQNIESGQEQMIIESTITQDNSKQTSNQPEKSSPPKIQERRSKRHQTNNQKEAVQPAPVAIQQLAKEESKKQSSKKESSKKEDSILSTKKETSTNQKSLQSGDNETKSQKHSISKSQKQSLKSKQQKEVKGEVDEDKDWKKMQDNLKLVVDQEDKQYKYVLPETQEPINDIESEQNLDSSFSKQINIEDIEGSILDVDDLLLKKKIIPFDYKQTQSPQRENNSDGGLQEGNTEQQGGGMEIETSNLESLWIQGIVSQQQKLQKNKQNNQIQSDQQQLQEGGDGEEDEEQQKLDLESALAGRQRIYYKLDQDFAGIMSINEPYSQRDWKRLIYKFFVRKECLNTLTKQIQLLKSSDSRIKEAFLNKNLPTTIPCQKFYKTFKTNFLVQVEIPKPEEGMAIEIQN